MKNKGINFSYGRQTIAQDDIEAVLRVLQSNWLTQGPIIQEFENNLSKKFGAKYVSVVSNGTAALHLTGLALGWKEKDIVITSPITFLASANCIVYAGATPDFVDIDEKYYTIDLNKLEIIIKKYQKEKKKIKAVVAVDYAGQPCDWIGLRFLANKYEFQLVNDNCHALGAKYYGSEKYALKYADAVCQSYHPVKHITTGEGGAVLTNNEEVNEKVKILRTHGIIKGENKCKLKNKDSNKESWYYEMQVLGFNYRITDFQCALGISQLKKLDKFVKIRREIAKYYNKEFGNDERFIIPKAMKYAKHSYHLYPLLINCEKVKKSKVKIFNELKGSGINCQVHYIPVYLQPYYSENFGFKIGDFPASEQFYKNEISIPMYPSLSSINTRHISRIIKNIIY